MRVYIPYSDGISTRPTKNFQVAKTSRPLIFTDDDSNASFAFFMLINFAVMTIGRFNIDLGYRH